MPTEYHITHYYISSNPLNLNSNTDWLESILHLFMYKYKYMYNRVLYGYIHA